MLMAFVLLHRRKSEAVGIGIGVSEAISAEGFVGGGGGEETAVGGEFDGGDGAFVAG